MNKATRTLVMVGMAFVASAAMTAGPASAAPASSPAAATVSTTASATKAAPSHDRVVGYFRNVLLCHRAGQVGEMRNLWDDHECSRVRGGFHRGLWVLTVSWDHHHGPFGHDNGHGDNHGHGHGDNHGHGDDHGHGHGDDHGHGHGH